MRHYASVAALLAAGLCASADGAKAQDERAAALESSPVVEVIEPDAAGPNVIFDGRQAKPRRPLLRWLFGKRYYVCPSAKPFVVDGVRYEPVLRDIRLVPRTHQLPGNDSGIPETLPVLPMYRGGYFLLPTVPPPF